MVGVDQWLVGWMSGWFFEDEWLGFEDVWLVGGDEGLVGLYVDVFVNCCYIG